MTPARTYNVLFLCTANSARSILAEALIEHWGKGRFKGYSAGSFSRGSVHPLAIKLLERLNLRTTGMRSKSWDEFAQPGAPKMDFVFTVCDQAAGEVCHFFRQAKGAVRVGLGECPGDGREREQPSARVHGGAPDCKRLVELGRRRHRSWAQIGRASCRERV